MIKLDLSKLEGFLPRDYLEQRCEGLERAADMLAHHNGPGGDFTGWVTKAAAEKSRRQAQGLVGIGSGGAYLGARAVI